MVCHFCTTPTSIGTSKKIGKKLEDKSSTGQKFDFFWRFELMSARTYVLDSFCKILSKAETSSLVRLWQKKNSPSRLCFIVMGRVLSADNFRYFTLKSLIDGLIKEMFSPVMLSILNCLKSLTN